MPKGNKIEVDGVVIELLPSTWFNVKIMWVCLLLGIRSHFNTF